MSSLSHIPQVEKNRSTASRNANNENSGHGAPTKAGLPAALSNDQEKSHSNLKRQRGYASEPKARPFQRTRTSSSKMDAEEKTIPTEKANLLGEDCIKSILAFLPVEHLVILRSLSKGTKVTVDEMVGKRAQRQSESLDLKLKYYYNNQDVKKRIRVHQEWTETLRDRKAVIDFAVNTGVFTWTFGEDEVNEAKHWLHKDGRTSDQGMLDGAFVGYVRDVKWNDTLEVAMALKEVAGYFRGVENCNKSRARGYVFSESCDDERERMVAEMNEEGQKILSAKDTILSLLLTNGRNTVSFSKIDSEDDYRMGDEHWSEQGSTILVFRLSNGLEIYLNSSFYENDQYCDY